MMDFLRALAPSHAASTRTLAPSQRAVPVMRSRFEDSRPLAHVPSAQVETQAQEAGTDHREIAGHHRAIARPLEPASLDDIVRAPSEARHVVSPAESRVTMPPAAAPRSVPSTPQPLQVRAVAAALDTAERAERVRAVPPVVEAAALPGAARPMVAPLQTAALPVRLTRLEAAGAPPPRGPLSSGAVAARSESRPELRPIIHVTIDRIDVRAPSVPERASSRPRSRSNTSASLSDYLRSRQASRSGGTS